MNMPMRQTTSAAAEVLAEMKASIESQLAELRVEIGALQGRLASATAGFVPKDEYVGRINDWLDTKAAEFERGIEFSLSPLRYRRPEPGVRFAHAAVRGGGAQAPEVIAEVDLSGLLAWLAGDAIKQRLAAAIELSSYPAGPPTAERDRMRAEIEEELTRLELQEERLVVQGEELGVHIARRPDIRPEIVLSLEAQR